MMPRCAYIGLGSNLSSHFGSKTRDSLQLLREAVQGLARLDGVCGALRVSRLYASAPMGPQDQPDYLNAAVCFDTTLEAHALLDQLQQLEQQAGRLRQRHWGERTLDLDLLLLDGEQIDSARLTVPHVGILQRAFVIQPLFDLNPHLQINGDVLSTHPLANSRDGIRVCATDWLQGQPIVMERFA